MGRLLSRLGCVVDVAENGAVAVEKVLARTGGEAYGIVFMDNQVSLAPARMRYLGRADCWNDACRCRSCRA